MAAGRTRDARRRSPPRGGLSPVVRWNRTNVRKRESGATVAVRRRACGRTALHGVRSRDIHAAGNAGGTRHRDRRTSGRSRRCLATDRTNTYEAGNGVSSQSRVGRPMERFHGGRLPRRVNGCSSEQAMREKRSRGKRLPNSIFFLGLKDKGPVSTGGCTMELAPSPTGPGGWPGAVARFFREPHARSLSPHV